MGLLNEIIEEGFSIYFQSQGARLGPHMFPLDYVLPIKVGQEILIDDFEVSKFRRLSVIDEHIKTEKRISTLLANANRKGVILYINRKKQTRNSGRIKFLSFDIGVKLYDRCDCGGVGFLLVVSNPNFLKRVI